jgi:regulator of RNase E activity RraB
MGLLDLFSKRPRRFVSQQAFERNVQKQVTMTPMTLQQLRSHNVTPDKERKLEFFFYTDKVENADALAAKLRERHYEVEHGPSASDEKVQLVTGWTMPMLMRDDTVLAWTREMCSLGFAHDCDFDGWGTNAE